MNDMTATDIVDLRMEIWNTITYTCLRRAQKMVNADGSVTVRLETISDAEWRELMEKSTALGFPPVSIKCRISEVDEEPCCEQRSANAPQYRAHPPDRTSSG